MLTVELLKKYFVKEPPHSLHWPDAVAIATSLQNHTKDAFPEGLLDKARPNEEPKYKEYRKEVYEPVTKSTVEKVQTTLCKIERAEDWAIKYEEPDEDPKSLQTYCEKEFPYFDTVTNWFFTIGIQRVIDDPNAVIVILPLNLDAPDNELRKPSPIIYPSSCVLEYLEGDSCVILDETKSEVKVGDSTKNEGNIFHFFDATTYIKAVQFGKKEDYTFELFEYPHSIGYMPAFKTGGKVKEFKDGSLLYESFISSCIPYWNEAIRRYSDHQVNMSLHLHPKQWEMRDTPCKSCNGSGKIQVKVNVPMGTKMEQHSCTTCNGTGMTATESPFGKIIVNPVKRSASDTAPVITPPGGYINRDIASIDFLKKEVDDCLKKGLSAINLEFLMKEPEVNSGVAKSYDRQEMNALFYGIARHVVENIIKPVYFFVSEWRYAYLTPDKRDTQLPKINVPTKFDLITAEIASNRLDIAIKGGFDKSLVNRLQTEYARKEFGEDCEEARIIEATYELDPLPNLTIDEKMTVLASNGCTQDDFVLSCKLSGFMVRAMEENEDFLEMEYAEQIAVLQKYAGEVSQAKTNGMTQLVDANGMPLVDPSSTNKLAQTASALDSMIKIAQAVAAGEYQLEAAVALVSNRFGISPEQARRELGNPVAAPANKNAKTTPPVNAPFAT